ncbi:MAG TPA: pyrroline-5-carboxylate reductase [Bacteroidia bacterium]|nr:pyrroline-5-carboxylate reductase [Bacteroidia bacterium]
MKSISEIKIAVIGAGNLGQSMALGWAQGGQIAAGNITCTRRQTALLGELRDAGIQVTDDNLAAVRDADVIVLALKPFKAQEILTELAPALDGSKVLVSVMSSIELRQMAEWIGATPVKLFRAMPNTATGIAQSITCLSHPRGKSDGLALVTELFEQLGRTALIEESLMEAATVLGACGIAFVMRFIRAMVQGGIQIGFDSQTASLIANQTVKGAAELLLQGGRHPEEEIDKVTTPKGCTIVGLNEMEHQGFSSALIRGIVASYQKIEK